MDREETLALWHRGIDAWNAWAEDMLAKRQHLEETGAWDASNEETRDWSAAATADFSTARDNYAFNDRVDFSGRLYPGNLLFERATFYGQVWFGDATFNGNVRFDSAMFDGDARFDGAWFGSYAQFDRARFTGETSFSGATFVDAVSFLNTTFNGEAQFNEAVFSENVLFERATFERLARFDRARFTKNVRFDGAVFSGETRFGDATFSGECLFNDSTFYQMAWFSDAKFGREALFNGASFRKLALFNDAVFSGNARFGDATFSGITRFASAGFHGVTLFDGATFGGDVRFNNAMFSMDVRFATVDFNGVTLFDDVTFEQSAVFLAIKSTRAFSLAGATFFEVPDFIQADFAEPPRLDNLHLRRPVVWSRQFWSPREWLSRLSPRRTDSDVMAKCRALRGIANKAHDPDRELEYRALEIRMARFNNDWPLLSGRTGSSLRFWLGWIYGFLSDFGRSVIRPLILWFALVAIFTCVYLSGHRDYKLRIAALKSPPALGWVGRQAPRLDVGWRAWHEGFPCVERNTPDVIALKPEITAGTNAFWQAFRMSVANAVVVGDLGGVEGARLAYGCLFGLERLQPARSVEHATDEEKRKRSWFSATYVPADMIWATRIQKGLSALLIFLFGLALRNLLKVK